MSLHNKNLIYTEFLADKNSSNSDSISNEKIKQVLETLAKQSMQEKIPDFNELEQILQNSVKNEESQDIQSKIETETQDFGGSGNFTKLLKEMGYLKENKKWLTHKGFLTIGNKILRDVMNDLNSSEFGLHETKNSGNGNVVIDTTKKYEVGDDLKHLSVPATLLNSIQRLSKLNQYASFPIDLEYDDLEQFETLEDVKTAIVYCIDLSSTMKYTLGDGGKSRIEAAKRALWALYALNKKFFPNDIVFVIGFASMASKINPYDIPFLKTFDANDDFLHYTNYQAALRLSRKLLKNTSAHNKRIILITDGQPSACFVENDFQKNDIIKDKPYSNFYQPTPSIISKIKNEKDMTLDSDPARLVYLCYRYKKVDPKIEARTLLEAKKCKHDGIEIDSIVISDESELLDYIKDFEKQLRGKTYHIEQSNMDKILVMDYLSNTRKILNSKLLL